MMDLKALSEQEIRLLLKEFSLDAPSPWNKSAAIELLSGECSGCNKVQATLTVSYKPHNSSSRITISPGQTKECLPCQKNR